MPDGKKLEAHSGLGRRLDDPRYVKVKDRGPTPPNVYRLTLRERLFHGVRAIRLKPVDDDKMFGRDGMLAHSYMLGPNGQSNGCVSFKDYRKFLTAFLNGEVDRLIVVPRAGAMVARAARPRHANATPSIADDRGALRRAVQRVPERWRADVASRLSSRCRGEPVAARARRRSSS